MCACGIHISIENVKDSEATLGIYGILDKGGGESQAFVSSCWATQRQWDTGTDFCLDPPSLPHLIHLS